MGKTDILAKYGISGIGNADSIRKKYGIEKKAGAIAPASSASQVSYSEGTSSLPEVKRQTVERPSNFTTKAGAIAPVSGASSVSYSEEMSRLQEARRQGAVDLDAAAVADAEAKMKALRASADKQTVGDRISDVISGSFNDFGSAVVNTLGVANNAYHDPDYNRRQIARLQESLTTGRTTDGKIITPAMRRTIEENISRMKAEIQKWESEDSAANKLYKAADTMKETSEEQVASAKEGLGKAGQFAVDVGVGAAQLAGDIGANLIVPGAGLAMMGVRGFGGASQEARQNGATLGEQVAYGAGTAAAGILTEKLANVAGPFKKAFGGGVLDKALSKITAKPAGKLALSALSESSEEALESVMQPVLQKLTYNPEAQYDEEWLAETLYSAAVGAVLGGLGGSVDVIGGGDTEAGKGGYKAVKVGSVKAETGKVMEELGVQKATDRLRQSPEGEAKAMEAYGTTDAAKQAQYRRAEKIAQRFGAEFRVAELGNGSAGQYADGVITIDPTANNPVMQVLVHELTHHMEASGMYQQFSAMVEKYIAEDMGADIAELKSGIMAEYAEGGFQLDEGGASRELVAKFAETKLFQDEKAIRRLMNEDRTLFEKIRDWINDAMVKVRGTSEEKFLEKAQKLYAKALSSTGENTENRSPQYSFAKKKIPTYDELIEKPDVKVVDIRGSAEGTYSEQKKALLGDSDIKAIYETPVVNKDTGESVFITPKTFTHMFSNKGQEQIDAARQIRNIVENAVLTHSEETRNDRSAETGVYTLFGAVQTESGIQPVKVKIKEYSLDGRSIPKEIRNYFDRVGETNPYARVYDSRVLVVEGIEKEGASSSALTAIGHGQIAGKYPLAPSVISVKDLVGLVNEEYQKYLPAPLAEKETNTAKAENPSPGAARNTVFLSKPSVRESGTDVNVENLEKPRYLAAPGKDTQQSYGRSFDQLASDVRYLKTAE